MFALLRFFTAAHIEAVCRWSSFRSVVLLGLDPSYLQYEYATVLCQAEGGFLSVLCRHRDTRIRVCEDLNLARTASFNR